MWQRLARPVAIHLSTTLTRSFATSFGTTSFVSSSSLGTGTSALALLPPPGPSRGTTAILGQTGETRTGERTRAGSCRKREIWQKMTIWLLFNLRLPVTHGRRGEDAPPLASKNFSPPLEPKIRDLKKFRTRKGKKYFLIIFFYYCGFLREDMALILLNKPCFSFSCFD